MIIVSGKVAVKAGAIDKMRSEMDKVINATRQEVGCLAYSYGVDVLEPDTIIILEYWDDWASLETHFTQPHMAAWIRALGENIVSRDIKAVEAGETRTL